MIAHILSLAESFSEMYNTILDINGCGTIIDFKSFLPFVLLLLSILEYDAADDTIFLKLLLTFHSFHIVAIY